MKYAIAVVVGLILLGAAGALIKMLLPAGAGNKRTERADFRMSIDDVFALKQRGSVVVVGVITTGDLKVGDTLTVDTESTQIMVQVNGIELGFNNPVQSANPGDKVGVMLSGIDKDQIRPNALLRNH